MKNIMYQGSSLMTIQIWIVTNCFFLYNSVSKFNKRGDITMQSAYIHLYLIIINVITFAFYGMDKWRAMTRQWRIREKKLIGLALIGGSVGAMIGMTIFHHKTRKWYFKLGIPAILVIQVSFVVHFMLK